jgi:hypothetical protein
MKNNTFSNQLLALILQNLATGIPGLAVPPSTGNLTVLYLALHGADPTASGNQTSSEVAYTGYARASVARGSAGFTVTGNQFNLTSVVNFPACSGGSATAAFASIGTAASGTGEILWSGAISPTIAIANGVTPQLTTASLGTET